MSMDKDTEIRSRYEDYSVDQLREALDAIFLYSEEFSDAEIAEMDKIMAVLKKKNPIPHKYTAEESWREFQETYAEELSQLGIHGTEEVMEKEPAAEPKAARIVPQPESPRPMRYRNFVRVGLVVAAVIVLMVAVTAAASAMGFNLWGWVPKWGDEVLSFESEEVEKKPTVEAIPDMLIRLGITDKLYPTWLPEDFTRTEARIGEKPFILHETFQGDNRNLIITISPTSGSENAIYQKEGSIPMEYFSGNTVHYLFDNTNNVQAVWHTESFTTVIDGSISLDEMKNIIDSVYEVRK